MEINWGVGLQRKSFLVALFALAILFVQQVNSIFGFDTTIYNEQATELLNMALALLILIGVIVNLAMVGAAYSEQMLGYNKPRDDLEGECYV